MLDLSKDVYLLDGKFYICRDACTTEFSEHKNVPDMFLNMSKWVRTGNATIKHNRQPMSPWERTQDFDISIYKRADFVIQ